MKGLMPVVRTINLRHLLQRRIRALLTLCGIAAGVALVFSILVINATLLSSFRHSLRELAGAAELEVAATDQTGLPNDTTRRVAGTRGVESAAPVVRTITTMSTRHGSRRLLILGVDWRFASLFPQEQSAFSSLRIEGRPMRGPTLLLAVGAAEAVGTTAGDRVTVATPTGPASLRVSATMTGAGVAALNGGNFGVMALPAARATFSKQGRVDSIYVAADPAEDLADVQGRLQEELGGAAVVGAPGERGRGLERIFQGLATLLSMAAAVALFVSFSSSTTRSRCRWRSGGVRSRWLSQLVPPAGRSSHPY